MASVNEICSFSRWTVESPTVLNVELTEWTQHPVTVDVRPTLTGVVCCGQLQAGFCTADTVRLVGMPVSVRHGLVGPSERLPDPWRTTVVSLTTCPVALVRQAEHAGSLTDTWQPLCTNVQIVLTITMFLKREKKLFITALYVMQTRYSDENSVRPSVCLSVWIRQICRPIISQWLKIDL